MRFPHIHRDIETKLKPMGVHSSSMHGDFFKNRKTMKPLACLYRIASVTSLLFVAGCSTPKPAVVAVPPPALVKISFHAQPNVNPDSNGRASPVMVKFYELKSSAAFDAGDFFSIFDSEQKTIGDELLNSEVLQLRPGEVLEFERTFKADTRYLAAIAAFRDLEYSQWRATLAIPSKEKISRVRVQFDRNSILITTE
jgi:type VI secretion system protein VasD